MILVPVSRRPPFDLLVLDAPHPFFSLIVLISSLFIASWLLVEQVVRLLCPPYRPSFNSSTPSFSEDSQTSCYCYLLLFLVLILDSALDPECLCSRFLFLFLLWICCTTTTIPLAVDATALRSPVQPPLFSFTFSFLNTPNVTRSLVGFHSFHVVLVLSSFIAPVLVLCIDFLLLRHYRYR